jgi:hypothetical protein
MRKSSNRGWWRIGASMQNYSGVPILSQPVPSLGCAFMSRVVKRSALQAIKPGPSGAVRSRSASPLTKFISPQLSQPVEKPPSGPQLLHQIKLDGYRMAARIDNGQAQLLTRTGLSWTHKYPSCESASEFDPSFLRQFNELPRRSAFGPHAE